MTGLKNKETIHLTSQGAQVHKKSKHLIVWKDNQELGRILLHATDKICVYGVVNFSAQALNLIMKEKIPVYFFTKNGFYRGALNSNRVQTYKIQEKQLLLPKERQIQFVKALLVGTITNKIALLKRYRKKCRNIVNPIISKLEKNITSIKSSKTIAQMRGFEGYSAKQFFSVFDDLLSEPWVFAKRTRRPPKNYVNCCLSLGYTLIQTQLTVPVIYYGLNPYKGFLHKERYGRFSLVLDLLEPLRPIIDFFVIKSLNLQVFSEEEFNQKPTAIEFTKEGLQKFIQKFDETLNFDCKAYSEKSPLKNYIHKYVMKFVKFLLEETEFEPLKFSAINWE